MTFQSQGSHAALQANLFLSDILAFTQFLQPLERNSFFHLSTPTVHLMEVALKAALHSGHVFCLEEGQVRQADPTILF